MPRPELSAKATELLEEMPPYLADSPWVQDMTDAVGREFERLEEFINYLRDHLRPTTASDEYRLLGLWEAAMGLPVEPEGVPLATRVNRVAAGARRRLAGSGEGWVLALSLAVANSSWKHLENTPGDYQLSIEVPFASTNIAAGTLEQLLRQLTPANLEVGGDLITYGDSFRVGISEVGDTL